MIGKGDLSLLPVVDSWSGFEDSYLVILYRQTKTNTRRSVRVQIFS